MTKEGEWTLEDLEEGCSFTIRKGGTQWVMGKPQGMYGEFVYCKAKVAKSARPGHGPVHRLKMFEITQKVYSTDCA
jgi:polyisoprenoid-binding protein YceI